MKPLQGRGEKVLYLDFDGVLHHENVLRHPRRGIYLGAPPEFTLFQHAELLESLLGPYPDLKVVLSTSWVRALGFSRTVKRLRPGLRQRVIGATYHSRMNEHLFTLLPRGAQVLDDVERRRPAGWIALDDDGVGWPEEHRHQLVLTDERLGLSGPGVAQRLEELLVQMHQY
jgi:hypothetical protein